MADGAQTSALATAEAIKAARFRPLKTRGGNHGRFETHPGVRMTARVDSQKRGEICIIFGPEAAGLLKAMPRDRMAVLVAEINGRLAIWVRKARHDEAHSILLRSSGNHRRPFIELETKLVQPPNAPSAPQPYDAHPVSGLIIWPTGDHLLAARAMAEAFGAKGSAQ